jgi:hypothetical protein
MPSQHAGPQVSTPPREVFVSPHVPAKRYTSAALSQHTTAAPGIRGAVRPDLPALVDELVDQMQAQVPKCAGIFQRGSDAFARRDIGEMVSRFVDRVAAGAPILDENTDAHEAFVRRAFLNGFDLNTLLAVSQVGAHVAWKHFAATGGQAGFTRDEMSALGERIFAYLEFFSAQAVEIYERLYADTAATSKENRKRLLNTLLSEHDFRPQALAGLAREAKWRLPGKVTCVAVDQTSQARRMLSPALDTDVLADLEGPDPHLLVPMLNTDARYEMLRRGLGGVAYAVGPVVPLEEAALSLRLARRALDLMLRGLLPGAEEHVHCDEHLPALSMLNDDECLRLLSRRALEAFSSLRPERRDRLVETLLTWLSVGSSLPEVAGRLNIHTQTARYRMRQIEEIFGERLHDPEWRFEMQLALRFHNLELASAAKAGPQGRSSRR